MDAVIVWTDTEGKEYRREKLRYLAESGMDCRETVDIEEKRGKADFFITVAAALRYIPEGGRVFVVSPFRQEWIWEELARLFPGRSSRIVTIDGRVLFSGFEGFLPSFSSIAATTLIYRITSLSRHFYLMRTGCIPLRPLADGIEDGISEFYGSRTRSDALSAGRKERIFIPARIPMRVSKKDWESCIAAHHGLLLSNLRQRFDIPRSRANPDGQTDIMLLLGNGPDLGAGYHEPGKIDHGTGFVSLYPSGDSTLAGLLAKAAGARFLEFAPLSLFTEAQRRAIIDYLCVRLEIKL